MMFGFENQVEVTCQNAFAESLKSRQTRSHLGRIHGQVMCLSYPLGTYLDKHHGSSRRDGA